MNELQRRLQAVVEVQFNGVARAASMAAGLNQNAVGNIISGATKIPDLETLAKLCDRFYWRLEDIVYWALGREVPPAPAGEPDRIIGEQLARLGYEESRRQLILKWLVELRPPASSNAESP